MNTVTKTGAITATAVMTGEIAVTAETAAIAGIGAIAGMEIAATERRYSIPHNPCELQGQLDAGLVFFAGFT